MMGDRYMALLAKYPYRGHADKTIRSQHLISFLLKLLMEFREHQIIDIFIRRF